MIAVIVTSDSKLGFYGRRIVGHFYKRRFDKQRKVTLEELTVSTLATTDTLAKLRAHISSAFLSQDSKESLSFESHRHAGVS